MELLIFLLERPGELISRDEIAAHLWGKDVFVDVDHSINTAVRKIRSTLRDDPEKPLFVETVVGKGYRFAAPVICSNGDSIQPENPVTAPAQQPAVAPAVATMPRAGRRLGVLLVGLAVLVVVAGGLLLLRGRKDPVAKQPAIKSLAVLPLKNLSGDPGQEYLADGITEAIIGRLSMIPGLRVISRTSAMRFKATSMSVPEIARTLHVDAVVEGSVQRENNQVRVTVQLIRGATDEHIWSQEYNREYRSLLALQEEMARTIAGQVTVTVALPQHIAAASAPTVDAEAHENYLKGRYYLNQRTEPELKRSIAYFQQALARDSKYALAYCGLADAYALLGFRGRVPSKAALSSAKAAAVRAIALDDTLADAHASIAFIAETHEWDWATAEREFKRALELDPGNARAHHWYAGYLMYVGRHAEGLAEAKRARDLDPLSLPINNALAGRLLAAGRVTEALQQVREALDMNEHYAPAHQTLGWVNLHQGKREDAIREFKQALQLSSSDDPDFLLDLGFAQAAVGNRDEAEKILAHLKALNARGLVLSGPVGILYGALGQQNEAFTWLDKAYEERDLELTYLKAGRRFAPLRQDPRFQQLVHRMGLPE